MTIDTHGLSIIEACRRIRDGVLHYCQEDDEVEVLIDTPEKSYLIKDFLEMSGCRPTFEQYAGGFLVTFRGSSCRCS